MIFNSLFKPKWQHRNPQIRKNALLALDDADNADIWQTVAREDADPELRALAAQHLSNMSLLRTLMTQDTAANVREAAHKRLANVIAGTSATANSVAERVEFLNACRDPGLIEHIALAGVEPELRAAAMRLTERESLLIDICSQDLDAGNRLAAAEKLRHEAAMERAYKQVRGKDKRVTRLLKERLDDLARQRAEGEARQTQAVDVCDQLGALRSQGNRSRAELALTKITADWEAVKAFATPVTVARFDRERQQLQRWLDEGPAAPNASSLRQIREDLIAVVERLADEIQHKSGLSDADRAAMTGILRTSTSSWEAQPELEDRDEQAALQARFDTAVHALTATQTAHQAYQHALNILSDLQKRFARLTKEQATADAWRQLRSSVAKIRWPDDDEEHPRPTDTIASLCADVDAALASAEAAETADAQHVEQFRQLVDDAEHALKSGRTHEVADKLRQARELKRALSPEQLKQTRSARRTLADVSRRLEELRDWEGWANAPQRLRLCEAMEELARAPVTDPHITANEIRKLQEDWRALGATDPDVADELWTRFKRAADTAYEPCKAHFQAESQHRDHNLKLRTELCEHIENFVANTDWSTVHWPEAFRAENTFVKTWRSIGPVDRKSKKVIQDRFDQVMQALRQQLNVERDRNQRKKEQLIGELESLLAATDIRAATDQAKQIQQQWKTIGSAGQRRDNELWRTLRQHCDTLFGRLRETLDHEQASRQQTLAEKEALCAEIEGYAGLGGAALTTALGKVKQAQSAWHDMGQVPKAQAKALSERFKAACQRVFDARHQEQAAEAQAQQTLLATKSDWLRAAEWQCLKDASTPFDDAAWQTFAALPEPVESALQRRADLLRAALNDADARAQWQQSAHDNVATAEALLLELEVTLELPTPPAFADARMQLQVSRLSETMGKGDASDARPHSQLERVQAWYLIGPIVPEAMATLAARFTAIHDHVMARLSGA